MECFFSNPRKLSICNGEDKSASGTVALSRFIGDLKKGDLKIHIYSDQNGGCPIDIQDYIYDPLDNIVAIELSISNKS